MPSKSILCVCVLYSLHKHIASTDIMKKHFDWAIKTSHMWCCVIKQMWHYFCMQPYEHGRKSTNFPQSCGICLVFFLRIVWLDEGLSNPSSAWGIIHTMRCAACCYEPQVLVAFYCFDSFAWPSLLQAKPTNVSAGPAAGVRKAQFRGCGEHGTVGRQTAES